MGSRRRNYIQDGREFRGVLLRNGELYGYTGPYDSEGKAKASVTRWMKHYGGYAYNVYDGYVEYSDPQWNRLD